MEVREKIIETFWELIMRFGVRGITIDRVSKRCGISKKTFYKYFSSKDVLVRLIADRIINNMKQKFNQIYQKSISPEEKLNGYFHEAFTAIGEVSMPMLQDLKFYYPDVNEKIVEFRKAQVRIIEQTICDGMKSGKFKKFNPALVTSFITGAASTVLNPDFILEHNMTLEETLMTFKNILLEGLLVERDQNNYMSHEAM